MHLHSHIVGLERLNLGIGFSLLLGHLVNLGFSAFHTLYSLLQLALETIYLLGEVHIVRVISFL